MLIGCMDKRIELQAHISFGVSRRGNQLYDPQKNVVLKWDVQHNYVTIMMTNLTSV